MAKKKLVIGITSPGSILLIEGQAKYFVDKGYEVFLMCPKTEKVDNYCRIEKCTHLEVDIDRNINPVKDFFTLIKIYKIFGKIKPDIINVGTPKMGLLAGIAGYLRGIKKRLYTCRGFRYEHEKGALKKILMLMEKISSGVAHKIICIAPSVYRKGVEDGIFKAQKGIVIAKGSSNGVDITRYSLKNIHPENQRALFDKLALQDKFVYGFVGRIVDRKGIEELYYAFDEVYKTNQNTKLIILGKEFYDQLSHPEIVKKIESHPGISWEGFQKDVPLYMSLFDVLVLPAWWEGFGNALIQAAAMGVPVISTRATGCMDAVKDGYNGILVEPKSIDSLKDGMLTYLNNPEIKSQHGKNGFEWSENFRPETIWQGLEGIYNQ